MLTGAAAEARERELGRVRRIPADAWLVVGITALAAVLRFVTLTSQSVWFDEAQAVHEMQSSFGAMWHLWSGYEPNPPLYFVIAWPWTRVFGTGVAGVRSLSAVLGTLTVPLAYLCGRELVSRRAGLVAALLTAVSPFMIWYSQEAREYMLLAALSAASLLFFARAWRTGSRRDTAWWAVLGALTLLSAYFGAFLIAGQAVALLWRRRTRVTVLGCALLVIALAAVVPHLLGHADKPSQWISSAGPLGVRARQVPVTFALNTLFKGPALHYSLIGAGAFVVVVLALALVGATDAQLRGAGIAAALAAVVLLVPLVFALAGRDYYEARALIGAWVPLAVVAGAACAAPRARAAGAILALVLVAGSLYGDAQIQYGSAVYRRPDWHGVARALGATRTPRAIVAWDSTFATAPLAVYLPHVGWTGPGQDPQPMSGAPPATVGELDVVGNTFQSVARPLPRGVRLISSHDVGGYRVLRFALAPHRTATHQGFAALAGRLLQWPPGSGATLIEDGDVAGGR